MLPAAARLRRSRDFRAVIRRGRRAGSPGGRLVVHLGVPDPAVPDLPGAAPRAGVVVSRAVGGAVVRTAVKRRLRHLLRARLDALAPGTALVVRALPPAAGASSSELEGDLGTALDRALRPRAAR